MIHFAIGTKAQFIKMAPLMRLLEEAHEHYHLLDLSQHGNITGKILSDFDLKPTITSLTKTRKSVTTYRQAVGWFSYGAFQALMCRRRVRDRLFIGQPGIVLLHGDTLSTLLGYYLAKSAGLKTALVEAGLSSGRLLDPFPEELIRRYVGMRADLLFPPDDMSEAWLRQHDLRCPIINTRYNTGRDSLSMIVSKYGLDIGQDLGPSAFGVATLHRLETLTNKKRLTKAVRHILSLAKELSPLKFYVHPPTANALKKYGLANMVESSGCIEIHSLEPYPQFVGSLMKSRFILTDGGSIQEEASYLMKPCLILRNRTERRDGIGNNAGLATWDTETDSAFLRTKIDELSQPRAMEPEMHASRVIIKSLDEFRLRQISL